MAENTDEGHLENPSETESKYPSEEILPTIDTDKETLNMEILIDIKYKNK